LEDERDAQNVESRFQRLLDDHDHNPGAMPQALIEHAPSALNRLNSELRPPAFAKATAWQADL
jgi:hypothetical protein